LFADWAFVLGRRPCLFCGNLFSHFALGASIYAIWPRTPRSGNDLSWVTFAEIDELQIKRTLEKVQSDEGGYLIANQLKALAIICRSKVYAVRIAASCLLFCAILSVIDQSL
jgi:hypothetical protein